jgi:predicted dienelactone hydrolase
MISFARFWIVLLLASAFVCRGVEVQPRSPSLEVATVSYEWKDAARDREVPAKVYFSKGGSGPLPIVIFSHGLGGSRDGYAYLGQYWAGCGYVSVHLQHHGSDDAVWKDEPRTQMMQSMARAAADPRNAMNRPKDVSFAIDQLTKLNAEPGSPLAGRLDLKHIAVAGHSFGGFTAMAIAGQALGPRGNRELADPRVKCVIAMSAPVPRENQRSQAYDGVAIPTFHMSGTKDDSPIGDTKAADRHIPFDLTAHAETCLVIFNGGDHMTFSDHSGPRKGSADDAEFQRLICAGSVAFLDAFLKESKAAHGWLTEGGYQKILGDAGTFETKHPPK